MPLDIIYAQPLRQKFPPGEYEKRKIPLNLQQQEDKLKAYNKNRNNGNFKVGSFVLKDVQYNR